MKQIYAAKGNFINFIVVFIAILLLYHFRFGLGILNPTNFGWLMKHDWAAGYLSWSFYRHEPWGFPIGHISNYLAPVGTNVGFVDMPLVLIPLKLLSPLLPDQFQYNGSWLVLCHVLLAFFLIRLFDLFSVRGLVQLAAVLIIVFNPVLLHRSIHPNLCVHWIFVASLWVYFMDTGRYSARKLMVYQGVLLFVSGLINPQICLIQAGFFAIQFLRLWWFEKSISFMNGLVISVVSFSILFAAWFVVGYFEMESQSDLGVQGGFGLYSLNLNSLYNSGGWSTIFPDFGMVSWHQYESFMYLGVGMIVLALIVLLVILVNFVRRKFGKKSPVQSVLEFHVSLVPLWILVVALTLLAITNVVSFNNKVLFTIGIPHIVQALGDVVRSSARFFWVVYYLILIFSIMYLIKWVRHSAVMVAALTAVFALQLYDYKLLLTSEASISFDDYHPPVSELRWSKIFAQVDNFVFYPPYKSEYLTVGDYRYFCYLAANVHKPITLGYSGRVDNKALNTYSQQLRRNIDRGKFEKGTLYLCTSENVGHFIFAYQAGLIGCGNLDGYYFFYPKELEANPAFSGFNAQAPKSLMERLTFKPFKPGPNDRQIDFQIELEKLERSSRNLFLKGWIQNDPAKGAVSHSILLRSEDNAIFKSPVFLLAGDSASLGKNGILDSLVFSGTYFTEGLVPGNYSVGLYVSSLHDNAELSAYQYFGDINVGYDELYKPREWVESPYLQLWIDNLDETNNEIKVSGWAFFLGQSSFSNQIEILLKSNDKIYRASTDPNLRPDVTSYFGSSKNLSTSGFISFISKHGLEKGDYEVGVRVVNLNTHQESTQYLGRTCSIK